MADLAFNISTSILGHKDVAVILGFYVTNKQNIMSTLSDEKMSLSVFKWPDGVQCVPLLLIHMRASKYAVEKALHRSSLCSCITV